MRTDDEARKRPSAMDRSSRNDLFPPDITGADEDMQFSGFRLEDPELGDSEPKILLPRNPLSRGVLRPGFRFRVDSLSVVTIRLQFLKSDSAL
jgi:hypothetical protein